MPNLKKYIQISVRGKPLVVTAVVEGTSKDYIEAKHEAEKNLQNLIDGYNTTIANLEERLYKAERDIKLLKGEE